jgi:cyanophycin synthetase
MKILEIRALRGPNYWSITRHKIIQMVLDIGDYEQKPTNEIPQFFERLKEVMPSLYSHRCSYDDEGGFFKRVEEGTWAGHVIEHIALELQTISGMETGFGRTRETAKHGVYNVVFSYVEEAAGKYTAEASVKLFELIAEGKPVKDITEILKNDIQKLREIREDVRFGPSTGSIVNEAVSRGIPYIRLSNDSLVQLGYGIHQQRIQATITGNTSQIAVELACNKEATKKILDNMGVPVPKGYKIRNESDLQYVIESIGYPVVIKPLDSNHGKGITVNINNLEDAGTAFKSAKRHSDYIIVERSLAGKDFRALVINYKLISVAERTPAFVTGDGVLSIKDLIAKENSDPRRGYGHEKILTQITIDHQTLRILEFKGYSLETVLKDGEICYLKSTANLSTGGTAIDRTDEVHPDNIFMFERIAKIIGLDIAGIDVIAPDISTPLIENGGGIVEVNAAPGFRMHLAPSEGNARNVADPVLSMLFPPGRASRVPIIAVTGTNGKTTTTRLIAHILKNIGYTVGFTTTEGVYIGNRMVEPGDNTGPWSAQLVLRDPAVEIAVLESARGGILRAGLGFDSCNVGVVLNVTADHLGLRDINDLEDMARVKSVVPASVVKEGYAVLNADDKLVLAMRDELKCNVALFSMDENNQDVLEHTKNGGIACILENNWITLIKGQWKIRVDKVINIPITFEGKAAFMIQNVLAATLASYILRNVTIEDIKFGLNSFMPSTSQTPGRLNLIDIGNFQVLIDYAHNPAGMEALSKFISKLDNKNKVCLYAGTGDRRDDDIISMGRLLGKMFTEIIIKEDKDLRGREHGEIPKLLMKGIVEVAPKIPVKIIEEEHEPINYALKKAKKGDLVVIFPDKTTEVIKMVNEYRDKLNTFNVDQTDIPNL